MIFKRYQEKVVSVLKDCLNNASFARNKYFDDIDVNWVNVAMTKTGFNMIPDNPKNGLGKFYPRFCIKVPTGGGKTLLAVETIRQYQNTFAQNKNGLVVWIVPSETIYSQTLKHLKDKGHFYRQLLDQASGGHTIIAEKGQNITRQDIQENLVILFLMIQSVSRQNYHEHLKVFMDSGNYYSFFPADNRLDLHKELLDQVPNLDAFQGLMPLVKTSLGNVIRVAKPLIIIDEFHKVFTPIATNTIDSLNPEMVVGFSATPKDNMNLLVTISGQELKDEGMVKLDLHLRPPLTNEDWQNMLREAKDLREKLEVKAKEYKNQEGRYIRPITLVQVERTGKEQRGKGFVHSEDAKEYLMQIGVPSQEIAIKTSSQNDIEDMDLFSQDCEIRYIITKEALKEGWDCSFAYVLCIIPNVNSNTGTTQLVGRILRQPYAKKTGVSDLDESYVFFANGQTTKILNQIKQGFKNEGMEDLGKGIKAGKVAEPTGTKVAMIKQDILAKYPESLYLPIWLVKTNDTTYRRFNYDIDIKSKFDFGLVNLASLIKDTIKPSLSSKVQRRTDIVVTIEESKFGEKGKSEIAEMEDGIDLPYLSRRIFDVVDNPFSAREYANCAMKILETEIEIANLKSNFGFIVNEIATAYDKSKRDQEKSIFESLANDHRIILALSEDKKLGFKIPDKETIPISQYPNLYNSYLFDDLDVTTLNGLEEQIAKTIDEKENVIWWFRNKPNKNWYGVKGWRKGNIYPDFISAKKGTDGKLDLVYVIESKGEHLGGSEDTIYKKSVFKAINETNKQIISNNISLVKFKVNDKFHFEVVDQEEVVARIGLLFA